MATCTVWEKIRLSSTPFGVTSKSSSTRCPDHKPNHQTPSEIFRIQAFAQRTDFLCEKSSLVLSPTFVMLIQTSTLSNQQHLHYNTHCCSSTGGRSKASHRCIAQDTRLSILVHRTYRNSKYLIHMPGTHPPDHHPALNLLEALVQP